MTSFPVQKLLADISFQDYIEHQGIDIYSYHFLCKDLRNIFSYKSIQCYIFNSKNEFYELVDGEDTVKYPPIK